MIKRLEWDSECFGYEVGTVSIGTDEFSYYEFIKEAEAYQLVYIFSKNDLTRLPSSIRKVDEKITLKKELQPSLFSVKGRRGPAEKDSPSGTIFDLDVIDFVDAPIKDFNKAFVDLALFSG